MDMPWEILIYIFKDYYGQRCISKKLNDYNYHYYLDYFDKTPISKNEVDQYFQSEPDYMVGFDKYTIGVFELKCDTYEFHLHELIIKKSRYVDDLSNILMKDITTYDMGKLEIKYHYYQHFDLSTTFHILKNRLFHYENIDYDQYDLHVNRENMKRKRITDYVLKLYHQYVYDIKIENIHDYQLLCRMIHYTNLNISLLSCDQSIDDLTYSDLEDIIFFEGQVDDENRIEIENHQNYHLKCRELLLYKINHFLY